MTKENGGARGRLMNIYIHHFLFKTHADVSEDKLPLEQDFRSSKNNFRGHDISQGLDREPPSLPPHFLLVKNVLILLIFVLFCFL